MNGNFTSKFSDHIAPLRYNMITVGAVLLVSVESVKLEKIVTLVNGLLFMGCTHSNAPCGRFLKKKL